MWLRQLINESSKYTPRSSTSTSGVINDVTVGSSLPLAEASLLLTSADSSRCVGQFSADAQQLSGRAADREFGLLCGQEVTVHGMVSVDTDTAVHVHGGVRYPVPGLGRPECRGADIDVGRKIF